jgi:chromosomal replication initiation ATPase DnaA
MHAALQNAMRRARLARNEPPGIQSSEADIISEFELKRRRAEKLRMAEVSEDAAYTLAEMQRLIIEADARLYKHEQHRLRWGGHKRAKMEAIVQQAAIAFNVAAAAITGNSRHAHVIAARHVAMYIGHKIAGIECPKVALWMGKKDHSNVLYACKKVQALIDADNQAIISRVQRVRASFGEAA